MNIGLAYTQDFFHRKGVITPIVRLDSFLGINCPTDYTITADTKPDCDEFGPDCYWEGKHWVKLHQEKVKKYGKKTADEQWAAAWNSCRGLSGAFGHELSIANNDLAFRTYIAEQGLNKSVPDLAFIAGTAKAADVVVSTAGNLAEVVQNTTKAAANTAGSVSTIAKWLPWIALAAAALLAYILFANQKSIIQKI